MPDFEPILNALLYDLALMCLCFVSFGILNVIPSMVVAFFAAGRASSSNFWPDYLPRGTFWGWVAGVSAASLSFVLLMLIAEMHFAVSRSEFFFDLVLGFAVLSFVVAICVQYHVVTHFYRGLIQNEDTLRFTVPQFQPVKQRFKFSLKTLLITQIVMMILFALWVGARRNSILEEYEQRRIDAAARGRAG